MCEFEWVMNVCNSNSNCERWILCGQTAFGMSRVADRTDTSSLATRKVSDHDRLEILHEKGKGELLFKMGKERGRKKEKGNRNVIKKL